MPEHWWQHAILYRIYPRSFMDSDGDGVGDVPGIGARLDHVSSMSADAIWLSPAPGPSEQHPELFQTDLAQLTRAAEERGMRVLVEPMPAHCGVVRVIDSPREAAAIAAQVARSETQGTQPGTREWPIWSLGDQDRPRIASRIGIDQARVAAVLLLTLRGTPALYYGDEIGMTNIENPDVRDPDGQRTPMQWDGSANSGFTRGTPWLPVDDDYPVVNVEAQSADPVSMLQLYRRLTQLRRRSDALARGEYKPLTVTADLVAFTREFGGECLLIALNLGAEPLAVSFSQAGGPRATVLVSTHLDRSEDITDGEVNLRADEGVILSLLH